MPPAPESGRQSGLNCDDAPIAVITGGTGLVGTALVRQLTFDLPDHRLVLLTRRPAQVEVPRVTAVYADVAMTDLGLDATARRMLEARADVFLHCAADTRFNLPLEQARGVNTLGTRNVMQMARACRNLTHFAHISTLYVAGRRQGLVREQPLRHTAGYVNTYEASSMKPKNWFYLNPQRCPSESTG